MSDAPAIGREQIEALVPHAGGMSLWDEVLGWDAAQVRLRAHRHRDPDHPLRSHGQLRALHLCEYGAQAMAVHGALLDARGAPLGRGYLASVRSVKLRAARLDDVEGPLQVSAERLSGEDDHVLYAFSVAGDAGELVSGRATVVLDALRR